MEVVDVDLLPLDISKQQDQHVSSSNTLHQDIIYYNGIDNYETGNIGATFVQICNYPRII